MRSDWNAAALVVANAVVPRVSHERSAVGIHACDQSMSMRRALALALFVILSAVATRMAGQILGTATVQVQTQGSTNSLLAGKTPSTFTHRGWLQEKMESKTTNETAGRRLS